MPRRCDFLVERFLPEVVDSLREAAAVAQAAEEELATGGCRDSCALLIELQTPLQTTITLLRVMDFAGKRCAKPGYTRPRARRAVKP